MSSPTWTLQIDGAAVSATRAIEFNRSFSQSGSLIVDATLDAELADLKALPGQKVSIRFDNNKVLKGKVLSGVVDRLEAKAIRRVGEMARVDVVITCSGRCAATDSPRTEFYAGPSKHKPLHELLAPLFRRVKVEGKELLNLPVQFVVQCSESDIDFLRRVAAWCGAVVVRDWEGGTRLLDPSEVGNPATVHALGSNDLVSISQSVCASEDVPRWEVTKGIVDNPRTIKALPKTGPKTEPSDSAQPGQSLWWAKHLTEAAETLADSSIRQQLGDSVRWWGVVDDPDAEIMTADHVSVAGVGDLAVWSCVVDFNEGGGCSARIDARDPNALPAVAFAQPACWVPGQVCNLDDPDKLGRIKVSLPSMERNGSHGSWDGVWCVWAGAGGLGADNKVHGPWSPPRPLDWVAVWIDPDATIEPLAIGSLPHRGCAAPKYESKSDGPWTLFREGDLKIVADPKKGEWQVTAGKNALVFSSKPEHGVKLEASRFSASLSDEFKVTSKKTQTTSNKTTHEGDMEIKGKIKVDGEIDVG